MTKQEVLDLNAELIDLLATVRNQIDNKLDELAAVAEDEDTDVDDEADDEADGD
jgi:hypothetical protein